MRKLKSLWRQAFDVRQGEYLRTLFMSLYLLFVLFAYYILKPVSRALFLNNFDIDKLPYLYILIAVVGGVLAYVYTKLALKSSLSTAVTWAMGLAVACLLAFWRLIDLDQAWVYYAFNIWVSLFSIVLVSQGWLVAANVFDSREAKRLYGLLGMGAVLGAAFGGTFTKFTAQLVGTRNLLVASAGMVILAYLSFRLAVRVKHVSLKSARAVETEEAEFSFRDIIGPLRRYRHLQVIMGIITVTYIVDVLVEFQFSAMAREAYRGDHLTAFLGSFYGIYLNLITFFLQFFLTAVVVSRMGVGGTLQIMPVTLSFASLAAFAAPGVLSTGAVRLSEAAMRYTFNRTGMELLYLPLPVELKNRTKVFVDIFVDRMGRGIGGMLLVVLTSAFTLTVREIALVCLVFSGVWMFLSVLAKNEYVSTVRRRLATRRLDFSGARVSVNDPGMVALLERTAETGTPRQASYALSLLSEAPGYRLEPQLRKSSASPSPAVRAKVYELARLTGSLELEGQAMAEIRSGPAMGGGEALTQAVAYVLAISGQASQFTAELLDSSDPRVSQAALEAVALVDGGLGGIISQDWISRASREEDPRRRRLAAIAVGIVGDRGAEALQRLLEDTEPAVVSAACRAAGALKNRAHVLALVRRLSESRLRGNAIDALSAYGSRICGTLGDMLEDETAVVAVRRQIPRVLRLIPDQRSVDALLRSIGQPDLSIRTSVLKALNRLRESAPNLNYGDGSVTGQIMNEVRHYFELHATLAPFREYRNSRSAPSLLARSIEERLRQTIERLFRLLGLRYPPKEIYAAYLAVNQRRPEQYAAAVEFLDSVLDRPLKRVLLPLLDETSEPIKRGHELFGIDARDPETAIRDLIRSGDSWLVACAMAAAAELNLHRLAPEISSAGGCAGSEVAEVARTAHRALELTAR